MWKIQIESHQPGMESSLFSESENFGTVSFAIWNPLKILEQSPLLYEILWKSESIPSFDQKLELHFLYLQNL